MDVDEPMLSGPLDSTTVPFEPLPLAQRSRHETLWFEDGSVILATPQVIFRVYRGTLARHSPVFRDMFSLPQPAEGVIDDTIDGLPVIDLYDDPAELAHLLNALHDRSYYTHTAVTSFAVIKAILNLSTKYHIESLRKQAISHLISDYPNTLEALDKRTPEELRVKEIVLSELIQLARQADVTVLLPIAFYQFAWNLHRREETSEQSIESLRNLSKEDVQRLYVGREKLREALNDGMGKFCYDPSPAGCSSRECLFRKSLFLRSPFWRGWVRRGNVFNMQSLTRSMGLQVELCLVCKAAFALSMNQGRRSVWDKLPSFFGLQDWETLRASTPEFVPSSTNL